MATKKQATTKPAKKKRAFNRQRQKPNEPARMTLQQQRFVEAYLCYYNVPYAASVCGCTSTTAYRWMNESLVGDAIFSQIDILKQRTGVSQEYILHALKREADYYGEGSQHATRGRCLETLAKILRMYSDAVVVKGDAANPLQMEHNHAHDHSGYIKLDVRSMSVDQCKQLLEHRRNGNEQAIQETVKSIIIEQQGAKHGTNEEDRRDSGE